MKVGIDARSMSRTITGIGRYTLEMCRALFARSPHQFYLYSPAPFLPDLDFDLPNVVLRHRSYCHPILCQYWAATVLPHWIRQDKIDVFWGPAHRLPPHLPQQTACVVTIHDLVWQYAPQTMRRLLRWSEALQMPKAIARADRIVADSHATAEAVRKAFDVQEDNLSVVYPGVRPCAYTPEQLGTENSRTLYGRYILFVGTLEPRKNLRSLLEAYSRLPLTLREQTHLVLAGGQGWGREDLPGLIRTLGLSEQVHITGRVSEVVLAELYHQCEFVAMPSLYEGFGFPIVEGMVRGKAVLTANNSSMIEAAGDAGLLVDAQDIDSIRQGLEKLLCDTKYRHTLAARAQGQAEKFSWTQAASQLNAIFEEAARERQKS